MRNLLAAGAILAALPLSLAHGQFEQEEGTGAIPSSPYTKICEGSVQGFDTQLNAVRDVVSTNDPLLQQAMEMRDRADDLCENSPQVGLDVIRRASNILNNLELQEAPA